MTQLFVPLNEPVVMTNNNASNEDERIAKNIRSRVVREMPEKYGRINCML